MTVLVQNNYIRQTKVSKLLLSQYLRSFFNINIYFFSCPLNTKVIGLQINILSFGALYNYKYIILILLRQQEVYNLIYIYLGPLMLGNIVVSHQAIQLMTVRFNLLIYLVTFDILMNVGSYMGPEIIAFNKVLYSILFIVAYNRGIMSLFYYPNAETLRDIEFSLIKQNILIPLPVFFIIIQSFE